jgi:uncharacterized membrane protein YfcA
MIFGIPFETAFVITVMAFFAEYIDSTLGMGYGTILTPLLMLLFGFEPLQIVPAVLLSELVTGLLAGFTHHSMGNVNLKPKTIKITRIVRGLRAYGLKESINRGLPIHLKITIVIASCSIAGSVASVFVAVNIPKFYLKLYIGLLVLSIGVALIMSMHRTYKFSWKKIIMLGVVASFNKGMSGGGYGPVVTGGQLLSGISGKNAIGITSVAEGLTCAVGVLGYLLIKGNINWQLAPFLVTGGVLSVPLSALTVKISTSEWLRTAIGVITIILGTFTLSKLTII